MLLSVVITLSGRKWSTVQLQESFVYFPVVAIASYLQEMVCRSIATTWALDMCS